MFQSHLLVYNRQIKVGSKSPKRIEKRRAFVQYNNGTFGIIGTSDAVHLTLFEFANLLKKVPELMHAINLDVGYNDFSGVVKSDGSTHYFGKIGRDRTNNVLAFYRR